MRRIFGIILIVLAVISTINVVRQMSSGAPERRSRSEAYDRGRKAAKFTPILLFGLGFWLLRGSSSNKASSRAVRSFPHSPAPVPPPFPQPDLPDVPDPDGSQSDRRRVLLTRWRPSRKLGLLLAGVCVLGIGLLLASSWLKSGTKHRRIRPTNFPQTSLPPAPRRPMSEPNRPVGSAYQAGQKVQANWAGGWIPGTIIEPLGVGFSCRVQLEDRRFPHPLVLSTNLLRPQ